MLYGNGIYALEGGEIFEYNGHVEVLNTELHTLKMYMLNFTDIYYKEWEFTDGNKTILSGSHLNY